VIWTQKPRNITSYFRLIIGLENTTNDNALVEGKNGSIVRKWLGYCHIPQAFAPLINTFLRKYLVPYINYHRPCHYVEIKTDSKTGKQRKIYPYKNLMTPYEKLKSLPDAQQYLKQGIRYTELDTIARELTDLEAARKVQKAREKLLQIIAKSG
jgi:hypothetical protein